MGFTNVSLLGNLTRDPELFKFENGGSVVKFAVAVNRRVKVNEGWEDRVSFIDCRMFGDRGKVITDYLQKGDPIAISVGELVQDTWEKDDKVHSRIFVEVRDFSFVGNKRTEEPAPTKAKTKTTKSKKASEAPVEEPVAVGQEIPF